MLTFLAPGVACWACSFLLREPFTRTEQLAALVSVLGVTLIARPTLIFGSSSLTTIGSGTGDGLPATDGASGVDEVTPTQRFHAVCVAMLGVVGAAVREEHGDPPITATTKEQSIVCIYMHPLDRQARPSAHLRQLFCRLVHHHQRRLPAGHSKHRRFQGAGEPQTLALPGDPGGLWLYKREYDRSSHAEWIQPT